MTSVLGFIGGTGPLGRGLALRLARAGHQALLGSRDADRAREAAAALGEAEGLPIEGASNLDVAAAADVVVVAVPYDAQQATLPPLADAIGDKLVVNCVVPLGFDARGPYALAVPEGSAAQECQRLLPRARVVGAFQNVSARKLLGDKPLHVDVLLCSDDVDDMETVAGLVEEIPNLRPVRVGPLRLAGPVEAMTAVLIAVNKRYKTESGVRLDGLGD